MVQLAARLLNRIDPRLTSRGATAVEYALILIMIAFVIIGGVTLFGQSVLQLFEDSTTKMP
ncbi:MAG: Flp/Fap pilin component [Pseudonocardiales bacterium]|jgi:Flp pilus assembly pilin Flp|nr:Flp/Fap pilin component [Pseudonocardiales bacterium]